MAQDIFQEYEDLKQLPAVDFSQIGKPVINDVRQDMIDLDMDEQPELVHAALTAVQMMDVPNGAVSAYETEDGRIRISNMADTYTPAENGTVFLKDQGVQLSGATGHQAGVYIDITPQDGGGHQMSVGAIHHGSYDGTIDLSETRMTYDVDQDGNLTNRQGSAYTQEFGANIMEQEHGQWTVQAAQTLENTLGVVMGNEARLQIADQRPESAATQVGTPPGPEGAASLSGLNLQNMLTPDAAPDAPQVQRQAAEGMDM